MQDASTGNVRAIKEATRQHWDQSAAGWNSYSAAIRTWLREATDAMIDMAGVKPGQSVLDVAAGAGDQSLDLAARVGPEGCVVATDLSPAILEHAAANARRAGFSNVRAIVADAEELSLDRAGFDAAVSRLGLMLMPRPLLALRAIRAALNPGARFCAVVFSTPDANPCVAILLRTASIHAGGPARDPFAPGALFSLGREGTLDDLFAQAGFRDVATTRMSAPFRLPSVDDYLGFVRASASPVQMMLSGLDDNAREAAWSDIREKLSTFSREDGWEGPNELLLTVGKA